MRCQAPAGMRGRGRFRELGPRVAANERERAARMSALTCTALPGGKSVKTTNLAVRNTGPAAAAPAAEAAAAPGAPAALAARAASAAAGEAVAAIARDSGGEDATLTGLGRKHALPHTVPGAFEPMISLDACASPRREAQPMPVASAPATPRARGHPQRAGAHQPLRPTRVKEFARPH